MLGEIPLVRVFDSYVHKHLIESLAYSKYSINACQLLPLFLCCHSSHLNALKIIDKQCAYKTHNKGYDTK